jgi:hypothetical protein
MNNIANWFSVSLFFVNYFDKVAPISAKIAIHSVSHPGTINSKAKILIPTREYDVLLDDFERSST